jgi:hypothetical protein
MTQLGYLIHDVVSGDGDIKVEPTLLDSLYKVIAAYMICTGLF